MSKLHTISAPNGQPKKSIVIEAFSINSAVDQTVEAFANAGCEIFTQGNRLVRFVAGSVVPLTEDNLIRLMGEHCLYSTREGDNAKTKKPSRDMAKQIISLAGSSAFPTIKGISNTPIMRHDGSIVTKQGYDSETGAYLYGLPKMPEIPSRPTRADALAAIGGLSALVAGFCFDSEASRSVALSGMITAVIRAMMAAAPMHVFSASAAGTGKSYLTDVCGHLATGSAPPQIGVARDMREFDKTLQAQLMTGAPILSIDNANGKLESNELCRALTNQNVNFRLMGKHQQVLIDSNVAIFANGNNISIRGDLLRRVIYSRLDAVKERPQDVVYQTNPIKLINSDRGYYLSCIYIILRSYIQDGKRVDCQPLNSFEDWSRYVREPLIWLGKPDPVETQRAAADNDNDLAALHSVVHALRARYHDNGLTAAGIIKCGDGPLGDALELVFDGKPTPRGLTSYLSRYKDTVIDGHRIVGKRDRDLNQTVWNVEKVN